jgi:hypothetical protein
MKTHEILWAVSFLKMAINVAGMPIKWVKNNSKYWILLIGSTGEFLKDSDGKYLTGE